MNDIKFKLSAIALIFISVLIAGRVYAINKVPVDYANNVTGRLDTQISTTKTTGVTLTADTYRTASGSSPVTFPTGEMVLRFHRIFKNTTDTECVAVESGTTQNGATVTLGTLTRNISCDIGTQFTSNGDGLKFPGGSFVELVWGVHQAENTVFKDNAITTRGSGAYIGGSVNQPHVIYKDVTTAQRDSFTYKGASGESYFIFNSTTGVPEYTMDNGATYLQVASVTGSFVNATISVAGKVEIGTGSDLTNATDTGDSGAVVVIPASLGRTTSNGATDSGAVAVTNASGLIDSSFLGTGTRDDTTFLRGDNTFTSSVSKFDTLFGTGVTTTQAFTGSTTLDGNTAHSFTGVTIGAGNTLGVASGNTLLRMRIFGNMTLNGTINLDSKGGTAGAGGTGASGSGVDGGDGTSILTTASYETGGGSGGTGNGGGAGGGASISGAGTAGSAGGGGAGGAGASPDTGFQTLLASGFRNTICGGGGAGGASDSSSNAGGAGGAGGGCAVIYVSGDLTLGGSSVVTADGANGSAGTTNSGGGGGGGGGSVMIIVGGSIADAGVSMTATAGSGGSGAGGGGAGGAGKAGSVIIMSLRDFLTLSN